MNSSQNQRGFSLIELMVTVAIIGILSAIAIPNYQSFIYKAYKNRIASELASMKTLIEGEAVTNENQYASTGGAWYCGKTNVWGAQMNPYIPNQSNLPQMPSQLPSMDFMYTSNGTDYKLMAHPNVSDPSGVAGIVELTDSTLLDPLRDGGPQDTSTTTSCNGSGDYSTSWAQSVWSDGARCW